MYFCSKNFITAIILLTVLFICACTSEILQVRIDPFSTKENDEYACKSFELDDSKAMHIKSFTPHINKRHVHHLLLFGCSTPGSKNVMWDCSESKRPRRLEPAPTCLDEFTVLYAWTKGESSLQLPPDVSFKVGKGTRFKFLILQLHFKDAFDGPDESGVDLEITDQPTDKRAGILLLATDGYMKPHTKEFFEVSYKVKQNIILHPFAFRTHAHSSGLVNSAYHVRNYNQRQFWTEIGRRSPQLPQIFVPANPGIRIGYGDIIAAVCTMYNAKNRTIFIGPTRDHEMCNFYMMYWCYFDQILNNSSAMSAGPPYWYFRNDPDLDISAIPETAYEIPPPPNGPENKEIDVEDIYIRSVLRMGEERPSMNAYDTEESSEIK